MPRVCYSSRRGHSVGLGDAFLGVLGLGQSLCDHGLQASRITVELAETRIFGIFYFFGSGECMLELYCRS